MANLKECYDHLGNKFKSKKEMCEYYGVTKDALKTRLRSGWSLEEALIGKVGKTGKKGKGYCDHLGNKYDTIKQMCEHYNVNICTFESRIKSGRSLEEALTRDKNTHDHLGNKFKSKEDMCIRYGIGVATFYKRMADGWTLEDALMTKVKSQETICNDHLGNRFNSIREMCDAYRIESAVFRARISSGWALEDALTHKDIYECCDHTGTKFKNRRKMCEHYGIKYNRYNNRAESGWTIGEALGVEGRGLDASIKNGDELNNKVSNLKFAYTGRNGKIYYLCNDKDTGEELLLNADEILIYKQKDYKTAVEQLLTRRRGALNG